MGRYFGLLGSRTRGSGDRLSFGFNRRLRRFSTSNRVSFAKRKSFGFGRMVGGFRRRGSPNLRRNVNVGQFRGPNLKRSKKRYYRTCRPGWSRR